MSHMSSLHAKMIEMGEADPPETGGLCHAESKALIEAAQRVVRAAPVFHPDSIEGAELWAAILNLKEVLRHVTPDDEPEPDESKPYHCYRRVGPISW